MPAFTLAGEAFCSVWTSTFHSLCTLPLPEEIGFEQEEIVAGRRLYRWGSMQGGSIAAPGDAAFLSAPCRSSKGGSIILHRQDPGPRQKDDLDDQRSAAMVDSDGGAFPPGWRNEATPCQQPPKRPCFSKPGKLYGYDHPSRGRCMERLNFHVSMICQNG